MRKIVCVFLAAFLFGSFLFEGSGEEDSGSAHVLLSADGEQAGPKPLLLFFIGFDMLMCPSCLDSFLLFCRDVEGLIGEGRAWGILVLWPLDAQKKDHSRKIAEKKLRGFRFANAIRFPVLVDHVPLFADFADEGTVLVLFNPGMKSIKKYRFPLRSLQRKEILDTLSR